MICVRKSCFMLKKCMKISKKCAILLTNISYVFKHVASKVCLNYFIYLFKKLHEPLK